LTYHLLRSPFRLRAAVHKAHQQLRPLSGVAGDRLFKQRQSGRSGRERRAGRASRRVRVEGDQAASGGVQRNWHCYERLNLAIAAPVGHRGQVVTPEPLMRRGALKRAPPDYTKNLFGGRSKRLENSIPLKCSQGHTVNNWIQYKRSYDQKAYRR
jgi:hypothetical protein